MKGFIRYVTIGCISFTFSCTFYLFFSYLGVFSPFNDQMVMTMLFLSIGILFFIYLSNLLPIQNPIILMLLELLSVLLVLIGGGAIFELFPLTFYYIFPTIGIGVLTYVVVITVLFIGDQSTATQINTVIRNRTKEEFYE